MSRTQPPTIRRTAISHYYNSTVVKANQVVGMIRRSFKYMDKYIFVQLFTSRVRPILEYGNVIWNPRLIRDIDAVERVQRRATQTVSSMHAWEVQLNFSKVKR